MIIEKTYPKVAIVILNWNGREHLETYLPYVLASTYTNLDIYLADNGSTDDSIAFVQEQYPNIKIIENDQNYGFAGGYNVALQSDVLKDAKYWVLLNSDVAPAPNWMLPMVQLMEANPKVAACQPKIRAFQQQTHFEYAGAAGGYIDRFGYAFCKGRFFDICEEDKGQYDKNSEIFWATGAAMFIRSDLFTKFQGFDADFFAHMEEIDLCWRMKRAGYSLYYCADSLVYHLGGGTLPQGNPRKTYLNFRNNLIMLFKNLSLFELWTIFPIRLILDVVAAVKSAVTGNKEDAQAILKAQWHFYKGLPQWLDKRKAGNTLVEQYKRHFTAKPNQVGRYNRSIIIDYFIRGKRYFHEIF